MSEINKTKDYSLFKKHESNRPICPANLKKLIGSIKALNLLEFRPVLVDSQMRIIDGQHRLEAAKLLEIEVFYQINEDASHEDIVLLNTNQKRWLIDDYVNYYTSRGNQEYVKFKEYAKKRNIPLTDLMSLFKASNNHGYSTFRNGSFKFQEGEVLAETDAILDKLDKAKEIMSRYVLVHTKCIHSKKMSQALLNFIKNPQLDFDTFISKITYKADSIKPCVDTYSYYCMLRDIYNWKNSNPIE
jgi:hypothetical protein